MFGGECASLRTLSPWCARRVRFHVYWLGVAILPVGRKSPEGSLTAPDGLFPRPKEAGGSETAPLDEIIDSSDFNGYAVRLIYPEAVELPLARRTMSGLSSFTEAEGALRTWSDVREDERGPANPVDDFWDGARVGGNKVSTGEGFRPVDLVRKGNEVAILVTSPP